MRSIVLAGLGISALAVSACTMDSRQAMNSPSPTPAPVAATPPAHPISPTNMATACRNEIAEKLGVAAVNVTPSAATQQTDGHYLVTASARAANQATRSYRCRFDNAGRFVEVTTLT